MCRGRDDVRLLSRMVRGYLRHLRRCEGVASWDQIKKVLNSRCQNSNVRPCILPVLSTCLGSITMVIPQSCYARMKGLLKFYESSVCTKCV